MIEFIKKEKVLCIAAISAFISMIFVPPSMETLSFIDVRVLALLFCLMAVIAGLKQCNVFIVFAQCLLSGRKQLRVFFLILVLLPFFSSMFITNDVALITFVPFAILVLDMIDRKQYLIPIITLQTIAANLGSMATPFGNPQNLFLYTKYELTIGDFFSIMGKFTFLALVLLIVCCMLMKNETLEVSFPEKVHMIKPKDVILFVVLFILSLLSVLHILPYQAVFLIVVVTMLLVSPVVLKDVDYALLLTFVCFFIFSGNIGKIDWMQEFLGSCMKDYAIPTAIASSQVISNVPSAVLLSSFTNQASGLLIGTNLGGLGTLIASLASLISFKFYANEPHADTGKYLKVFTGYNLIFLLILIIFIFI